MIDYERWNSPSRTFYKDVLARGDAAVADYSARTRQDPKAALTENQVNRVGYWLLGKKRVKESVAVLEINVASYPQSWNAYDSLGRGAGRGGRARQGDRELREVDRAESREHERGRAAEEAQGPCPGALTRRRPVSARSAAGRRAGRARPRQQASFYNGPGAGFVSVSESARPPPETAEFPVKKAGWGWVAGANPLGARRTNSNLCGSSDSRCAGRTPSW